MSEMNLLTAEAKEHYSEGTHELHFALTNRRTNDKVRYCPSSEGRKYLGAL